MDDALNVLGGEGWELVAESKTSSGKVWDWDAMADVNLLTHDFRFKRPVE